MATPGRLVDCIERSYAGAVARSTHLPPRHLEGSFAVLAALPTLRAVPLPNACLPACRGRPGALRARPAARLTAPSFAPPPPPPPPRAVLNQCNYVVLDEADRMIDLGFEPQVSCGADSRQRQHIGGSGAISAYI